MMNKKIAKISIDLYQRGLLVKCEELEMEAMCLSGEELMDFLNDVQCAADPDVMFKLSEKGEAVKKVLKENPELTFEEACALADKVMKRGKMKEIKIERGSDGLMKGEVADLSDYLPFEIHDNESDTWELIEDGSALVDWSGDIDCKVKYDKIRTKGGNK